MTNSPPNEELPASAPNGASGTWHSAPDVQRVLDLDLDFFIYGVASAPFDGPRLDPEEYPPWGLEDAMAFLEERCHLVEPLPGRAVEHHSQVFGLWREGLLAGVLDEPFHVTHVDPHADLGMMECGHLYLLTEFLEQPPSERWYPRESTDPFSEAMTDGSYLAFAVGCRWISDLTLCPGSKDFHEFIMERWDRESGVIRMPRLRKGELQRLKSALQKPVLSEERLEPPVRLTQVGRDDFIAPEPFDFIFLAQSPAFTPEEADPIYAEIRRRFIDEKAWSDSLEPDDSR